MTVDGKLPRRGSSRRPAAELPHIAWFPWRLERRLHWWAVWIVGDGRLDDIDTPLAAGYPVLKHPLGINVHKPIQGCRETWGRQLTIDALDYNLLPRREILMDWAEYTG